MMPLQNASGGINSDCIVRRETKRCSTHSPPNAPTLRIPTGPQITRSMSSSSHGGKDRAGDEHTDKNHPNQPVDHRQCGVAKVTPTGGTDSQPGEDKGSVESDVDTPRVTSGELPEQGRVQ